MVNVEKFVISEVAPQQTNVAWFNPVDKKLRFYTNGWQELADENTQIQSDWNQSDNTKVDFIKNKPTIAQSDWNQADPDAPDYIKNKPTPAEPLIVLGTVSPDNYFTPTSSEVTWDDAARAIRVGRSVILVYPVDSEYNGYEFVTRLLDSMDEIKTPSGLIWYPE